MLCINCRFFRRLYLFDDGSADLKRRRCGRRGSIANMNRMAALKNQKIVHELAIVHERLSSHTSMRRDQILRLHVRDQALKASHKGRFAEGAYHLVDSFTRMFSSKPPETGI